MFLIFLTKTIVHAQLESDSFGRKMLVELDDARKFLPAVSLEKQQFTTKLKHVD